MSIAENSIQLPHHSAYHTIGLSYLMKEVGTADGRQDDVSSASIDRVLQQYLAICAEGCLRPSVVKEESSMQFEDREAGDNRYVFLSLNEKDWTKLPKHAYFGFIFDAYFLIEKGAILRTSDFIDKYTDALKELVAEQIGWYNPQASSVEETAMFKGEYLRLLDAVRSANIAVQGVPRIRRLLSQRVREIQKAQLTGNKAKAYLAKDRPYEFAELLVFKQLPLSWAIAAYEGEKGIQWLNRA